MPRADHPAIRQPPTLEDRIREAKDSISDVPTKINTREPDGAFGKRFTRQFQAYLENPPIFLLVLRSRRYSMKHWLEHWRGTTDKDKQLQVAFIPCGCVERPGYVLVRRIVVERRFIQETARELHLDPHLARRILDSELRIIGNRVAELL